MLNIGIIGVGRIGKMHCENLVRYIPNANVVAIADLFVDDHKEWIDALSIKKCYKEYKDLLNDKEVAAVVISTSTNTHAEIAIAAAEAKKDIFLEKPIDVEVSRIDSILEAVKKAGVKLQIGFNRRFDHNFSKLRQVLESGEIGEPHIIRIASRDPAPPPISYVKVSGGLFLDMMIHDFDMMRYISGSDIVEIFVNSAVLINPEIGEAGDVDTAIVTVKLANGALGVIDNSRQAVYGYDQRVELFGSKGMASASNDKPTTVEVSTAKCVTTDKIPYFFLDRYTQAFLDEFNSFVDSCLNDTPVKVDGLDGKRAVQVALAAAESNRTGLPVKIKLD